MLAITFRAQQAAFAHLCPERPPRREDIQVASGHPGPGVRDAFEMVTRCMTRGACHVDKTLPGQRLNPMGNAVYAWRITVAGRSLHVALRPGVLPAEFFRLLSAGTDADRNAGFVLRRQIAGEVLARQADGLFTVEAG